MTENDPAAIVSHDLYTVFGHGSRPAWDALVRGENGFSPCLRFHNRNLEPLYAALAPELENEPDISGVFLRALAPSVLPFSEHSELFLAATVGEIDKLTPESCQCTVDSLLERTENMFRIKRGRIISAACASGNAAVCRACASLSAKKTESAVVFGSDFVSEFVLSGFASLNAVSKSSCCRPYDRNRDGLLLGDAAGTLVLTPLSRAHGKRQPVLGLVTGCGMSCDAAHITAPDQEGIHLASAIRQALSSAGKTPDDVGAVIGHGTGTIYNDIMEIHALKHVFGDKPVPLLSVKGSTGHTLAAAGLVQISAALNILRTGIIPPQTSLSEPEPSASDMLSCTVRPFPRGKAVLSLNSGFGGLNAVLLLEAAL